MPEINWSTILPSYEDMLSAGMHYGRRKTVKHPKMDHFIYALKDSIHLINIYKTKEELEKAIEFLKKTKDSGGVILWTSLTKHSEAKIIEIANALSMPYIRERWLGGSLTNFKTIQKRMMYFKEIQEKWANPQFMEKLIKKEKHDMEKELRLLTEKFQGLDRMTKLPDVVFLSSLRHGDLPFREAKRLGIKIVAICNTESDPSGVDYAIPANDNAKQSVELILETIKKALK
ncbi:MAG: 30S ribosomal protein S2 [Parcubacteria group bacterium RIFCSPLOWO2_01_FULL_40_65]|nr:MAG: 30S ribosomal protein S2 [Parcubacteria group bacterium RIFCSPHIGHO2_01_FULL_40_30]OHB19302.1 MAG: 30S ribosomal protein S2 [Parcubacteria group bacterium RIFCSPHIGHO2_02_FULL_40_12]OHB21053.1 MAG: 30S ribosomal protein S2 [Parcubacteria group bacterium RIFCSPLOWO2_01_FULL_40_65]OHB23356.1 MAG: 30S ribosomal protein S2 [Parcubacteria group bacterium RIFCSPLOWO2_02_FULL_40_12]OHB24501.1 MAG: 30S ribosomal protein S2 [Parcubacteria group bacterium RIFCSPLOWO2_12_FULL_40_10]